MQAADTDKSGTINYTGKNYRSLTAIRIHCCNIGCADLPQRGEFEKRLYDV